MGQKVHPTGFRLGVKVGDRSVKDWQGRWFATGHEYASLLLEDVRVRQHIMTRMADAGVSRVEIERSANMITVTIHAAKPGIVIGKSGVKVEELRRTLEAMTQKRIRVTIQEIRQLTGLFVRIIDTVKHHVLKRESLVGSQKSLEIFTGCE